MTNPTPIIRAHKAEGFDDRRKALVRRIKILTAVTDVTMTQIAAEIPVTPDLLSHMLSGRRNANLSMHVETLEAIVKRLETNAKRRGVDVPK